MQLGLYYTSQDHKPHYGIFIEGNSIEDWAKALQSLKIVNATAFVIPNNTANSVSGLLVITTANLDAKETHRHRFIYQAYKNLFLLEHTELNMALSQDEVQQDFGNTSCFFHPEFGLIPLEKQLEWSTIFTAKNAQNPQIVPPKKGVSIPKRVKHFSVEIEDDDIEKNLLKQDDDPVDLSKLPFDMKKVMKGNAKELEKYMAYLEKHPEAALKLGVPLDMLGTSRGHAFAKFNFKSSFWDRFNFGSGNSSGGSGSLFGGNSKGGSSSVISLVVYIAIFIFGIALIGRTFTNSNTTSPSFDQGKISDINTDHLLKVVDSIHKRNSRRDSLQTRDSIKQTWTLEPVESTNTVDEIIEEPKVIKEPENTITDFAIYFIIICVVGFIFNLFLIEYRRYLLAKKQQSNLYNMPDDSAQFDFSTIESKDKKLYFGGNELNLTQKFLVLIIILGIMAYLIYPLMKDGAMNTVFLIIYSLLGLWFIYILINKHKTFHDGEDK